MHIPIFSSQNLFCAVRLFYLSFVSNRNVLIYIGQGESKKNKKLNRPNMRILLNKLAHSSLTIRRTNIIHCLLRDQLNKLIVMY